MGPIQIGKSESSAWISRRTAVARLAGGTRVRAKTHMLAIGRCRYGK